jgi:hypothetical protein
MSLRKAVLLSASLIVAAACGGESFSGGGGGDGGDGASAGSHAGKSPTAGASNKAGAGSQGGSTGTSGATSKAGTTGVGGLDCSRVDCADEVCDDGQAPVIEPGKCCKTCPPPVTGCEGVMCLPAIECAAGYELKRPEGACCEGCVPKPGGVGCLEIACAPDKTCPAGYVRGDLAGGCCYDCVPDPLYCNEASDCVVADRPRPCCGCPEAISRRQYAADECWSDVNDPRMVPMECYPQMTCDAICNECPPPGELLCSGHRCTLAVPM